jgi:uncharacterized membrane protein YphA (DoxX/SURF4 family)
MPPTQAGVCGALKTRIDPQTSSMAHPPPLQPEYNTPPPALPTGKATASMVCGILSLVLVCCLWPVALVLAIVAVALGASVQRDARRGLAGGAGMAQAGIICGGIVILLATAALVLMLVGSALSVVPHAHGR